MPKKTQYFPHDYNARNDTKIITLRRKCGMAGFGIFWAIIETLYEAGGELDCDEETLENLAYEWRCDVEMIKTVIFDCNLFVVDKGKFYSKSVNSRLEKINQASEKGKKLAEKRWNKKDEEKSENSQKNAESMHHAYESNAPRIRHALHDANENDATSNANKEINKKINKNNTLSKTAVYMREEVPKSQEINPEKECFENIFLEKKAIESENFERIATKKSCASISGCEPYPRKRDREADDVRVFLKKYEPYPGVRVSDEVRDDTRVGCIREGCTGGTRETGGGAENTEKVFAIKNGKFAEFFVKFPKKTNEEKAKIAFLALTNAEIAEISRVFPHWLAYWHTIPTDKTPNAYDWIFNRRWREKIPETMGGFIDTEAEKQREAKRQKTEKSEREKAEKHEKKLASDKAEREKFLQKFAEFSAEKQTEIVAELEEKFREKPVKKGDALWNIELVKIVKNL